MSILTRQVKREEKTEAIDRSVTTTSRIKVKHHTLHQAQSLISMSKYTIQEPLEEVRHAMKSEVDARGQQRVSTARAKRVVRVDITKRIATDPSKSLLVSRRILISMKSLIQTALMERTTRLRP